MSDVRDMTSQMAKELAAGIRDNVEDIAAAFKKMAIINPERKRPAQPVVKENALPEPETPSTDEGNRTRSAAQAAASWELYEGLLARTQEEKKKQRSKVAEVDENQLSIFDFAA